MYEGIQKEYSTISIYRETACNFIVVNRHVSQMCWSDLHHRSTDVPTNRLFNTIDFELEIGFSA